MPARTAKRDRFSGILNCSWCSSTVSQAGRPVPCGQGMVRERHMEWKTSMRTMPRAGGARGCSMLCTHITVVRRAKPCASARITAFCEYDLHNLYTPHQLAKAPCSNILQPSRTQIYRQKIVFHPPPCASLQTHLPSLVTDGIARTASYIMGGDLGWRAHLCNAVQAAIRAAPHAPANDVLTLGQEGEGECSDPAHHLAALLLITILQQLMLGYHGVLHDSNVTVRQHNLLPLQSAGVKRKCVVSGRSWSSLSAQSR